jgi:membrane associated rhomboid family serine protease
MLRFTCALARASSARARAFFSSSSSSSSPPLASASSLVARIGPLPVVFLLAANTAVCGTYLVYGPSSFAVRRFYDANMVLSARRFRRRRWTIVTHFFTHLDALHLVVNMLSIYSFGGVACQMLGNARFAILYTTSGLVGGLSQLAFNRAIPRSSFPAARVVRPDDAAVGASAAIAGIVCYYATRVPAGEITLFVLPVPNVAFVSLFITGSLYLALYGTERSNFAHAGHLGGATVGIAYALFRRFRRA